MEIVWLVIVLALLVSLLVNDEVYHRQQEERELRNMRDSLLQQREGRELYVNTDEEWKARVWDKPRLWFPEEDIRLPQDCRLAQESADGDPGDPGLVLFLNTDDNESRCRATQDRLREAWPHLPHYRVRACVVPGHKPLGILVSHTMALLHAVRQTRPVVICEDDFHWRVDPRSVGRLWSDFRATSGDRYDVFLPSPLPQIWGPSPELGGHDSPFYRVYRATTATMYVVTPAYARTLVNEYQKVAYYLRSRPFLPQDHADQAWHAVQMRDRWVGAVDAWCTQGQDTDSLGRHAVNGFTVSPERGRVRLAREHDNDLCVLLAQETSLGTPFTSV